VEEPGNRRKVSAMKQDVFIKGSSKLAGGAEQSSTEVKVCDSRLDAEILFGFH